MVQKYFINSWLLPCSLRSHRTANSPPNNGFAIIRLCPPTTQIQANTKKQLKIREIFFQLCETTGKRIFVFKIFRIFVFKLDKKFAYGKKITCLQAQNKTYIKIAICYYSCFHFPHFTRFRATSRKVSEMPCITAWSNLPDVEAWKPENRQVVSTLFLLPYF